MTPTQLFQYDAEPLMARLKALLPDVYTLTLVARNTENAGAHIILTRDQLPSVTAAIVASAGNDAAPLGKCPECRESPEATTRYIEALREIAKGEGEFSRDPLKHAQNTIENMKTLAVEALCPRKHDWENVAAGQVQCAHCGTWREPGWDAA